MSYNDDSSSTRSKTPANEGSYFEGSPHNISPSSKSPGINIPLPSSYGSTEGRPRRSSFGLSELRHVGGVNSIDAFARSWTRAAHFLQITPQQSYIEVPPHGPYVDDDTASHGESALLDDETDHVPAEYTHLYPSFPSANYGSLGHPSRGAMPTEGLRGSVIRHAEDLYHEQQQAMEEVGKDKEREPILVRTVETEPGVVQQVIVGQSTLPQTVFNSVNVLIGIGLLSLPLGLKYSGWIIGMFFLGASAWTTNYTAKLLARCLEKSPNQALVTYSDVAFLAYGQTARIVVSVLFSLELIAACVALEVLFADSLHSLIPSISVVSWKIIGWFVLTPLSFVPLRVLSFSSILGILSTTSIFLIVFFNGLLKPTHPGSLVDPAPQYLFPQSWLTLPIGIGLLMAPWSGHSVFPNIFKDMRHPHKFNRAVNITFWFSYLLDGSMMVVGLLIWGDGVMDEITANVLSFTGYPESTKLAMVVIIAIIPITKTPLNARPIISTCEILLGVDARSLAYSESAIGMTSLTRSIIRAAIRIIINIIFVIIAILFPSFDVIMSFLGNALCFSVCVILPLMFYLKIFGNEVSTKERVFAWFLIVVCSILGVVGTVFAFIPKEILGMS
ncbi:transmembrane amino acid transporter protein-domain-containing protein [Trichophaea hybrida]|nr:transmembrane amino acid transporter protein-domain-containing protein [Trichophaea hybrida]